MDNTNMNDMLLQALHRIAGHFKIEGAESLGFKKRKILLDKLKEADNNAWLVMNGIIEAQLHVDRILADKEKELKNSAVWHAELETAKLKQSAAAAAAAQFFEAHQISLGGISFDNV